MHRLSLTEWLLMSHWQYIRHGWEKGWIYSIDVPLRWFCMKLTQWSLDCVSYTLSESGQPSKQTGRFVEKKTDLNWNTSWYQPRADSNWPPGWILKYLNTIKWVYSHIFNHLQNMVFLIMLYKSFICGLVLFYTINRCTFVDIPLQKRQCKTFGRRPYLCVH